MIEIDNDSYFEFRLLELKNIFNILELDSYKKYDDDILKKRIQRLIMMLHSDQLD